MIKHKLTYTQKIKILIQEIKLWEVLYFPFKVIYWKYEKE